MLGMYINLYHQKDAACWGAHSHRRVQKEPLAFSEKRGEKPRLPLAQVSLPPDRRGDCPGHELHAAHVHYAQSAGRPRLADSHRRPPGRLVHVPYYCPVAGIPVHSRDLVRART